MVPEPAELANADHTTCAADLIAPALKQHGVEVMFSQSPPSRIILACEDIGIRQLVYRTENSGGVITDGYARRSSKVAIVCVQNEPAATLLIPPLAEAFKASIRVVAFVQDVNRHEVDSNAFQELGHLTLFESCIKWLRRVWHADRIEGYVDMSVTVVTTGRPGPAVFLLPAYMLNDGAIGYCLSSQNCPRTMQTDAARHRHRPECLPAVDDV